MKTCLICSNRIEPFMSFGPMPIANGFLTRAEFECEPFFELAPAFCNACKMVQLTEQVDRHKMFHENYAFLSSSSKRMAIHFADLATEVKARYVGPDPFVVEIGSNDGTMLQHFAQAGIRCLGVEPSANVAELGRQKGINTTCDFFDRDLARRIEGELGRADVILAANVMCHLPYIHSVVAGIKALLKPKGVLVFEDPYLGDIIQKTAYDQIYDEHALYFSITSLDSLFATHDMAIVDVTPQSTHGGSMRYTVAHRGALPIRDSVVAQRATEERLHLAEAPTYDAFRQRVERSREELTALLVALKGAGKRVVGYGATSKSTTVTNYCGITANLLEFIADTTPTKQGKCSPGTHIPVRSHADFAARYPDYALLFAWNHADEIRAKEADFTAMGGEWIVYVPRVEVQRWSSRTRDDLT